MLRDVQLIRAGGHQRDRCLTMQKAAGRGRHVPIDRIVHELVPEHDSIVSLVEELGFERVAELPNDLGRWAAGDSGDVTKRHGVAQHRRDLQQLQRCRRQVPQAANHEVARARPAARRSSARRCPRRGAAFLHPPASAAWPRPTTGSRQPWPAWRSAQDRERAPSTDRQGRPPRRASAAGAAGCARLRPPRSSSSRTTSAGSGDGRVVTTTSTGASDSWRVTDRIANRLALSAQWRSSATSSTGRSAHNVSTRSTISSTTRYWMSPAAAAGAAASSPASRAAMAALRGSGDRRLRPSAAETRPNGRVRSKGCAWPENTAAPRERASSTMRCTRRVLPMPASPSIVEHRRPPLEELAGRRRRQGELTLPPHERLGRGHPQRLLHNWRSATLPRAPPYCPTASGSVNPRGLDDVEEGIDGRDGSRRAQVRRRITVPRTGLASSSSAGA